MISYQWDSQPLMIKIKESLKKAGFKVWMDVENISQLLYTFQLEALLLFASFSFRDFFFLYFYKIFFIMVKFHVKK